MFKNPKLQFAYNFTGVAKEFKLIEEDTKTIFIHCEPEADDILLLDPPYAVFGKTADIAGSGAIEKVFGLSKGLSKGLSENYNCHEKNL